MEQKRQNEITGLRGLSACTIAYIFHYTELFHTMPQAGVVQETVMGFLARYSVYMSEVFFMLSGFLLYQAYQGRITEHKISFGNFMIPKMKKIYPMMIVTAFVTWLLQRIGYWVYGCYLLHPDGAEMRNSIKALIVSVLGIQSGWISDNDTLAVNGPSWFVSIYFLCYAIYYVLTYLLKKPWQQNLCYGGMAILGIALVIHPLGVPFLYCTNGRGYFSFFAGILLAQLVARQNEGMRQWGCVLAALMGVGAIVLSERTPSCRTAAYVSAFIWLPLIYLVTNQSLLRRVFGWKPFVWLGNLCMPIFLWNMATDLLLVLLDRIFRWQLDYSGMGVWLFHVLLSIVVAWAANRIDQRIRKVTYHGKTI